MYKPIDKLHHSFLDFNQPMGLHMNPDNRWIKLADRIPWEEFEVKYVRLFPSDTGNVAKPFRMALGALIIQTKFQYSDREFVEQIAENPYLQYFIGFPSYQEDAPFDASTLVLFCKRISAEMLMEVNEHLFAHKDDDNNTPPSSGNGIPDCRLQVGNRALAVTLDIDSLFPSHGIVKFLHQTVKRRLLGSVIIMPYGQRHWVSGVQRAFVSAAGQAKSHG